MTHDHEAALIMTKARISLIMKQPFFGSLALRLQLIQDSTLKLPTMAVDGKHIFYHPEFVKNSSFAEIEFVVAHEVGHCIYDHMGRRGARNPRKWNRAGDYVINAMLVEVGMSMPKGGLLNAKFAGMTTDEVYGLLKDGDEGDGKGPLDEVRDNTSNDPSNIQAQAEDWKIAVVQAANGARGQGKLHGSLARFVDQLIASKADWRSRLRAFVAEESRNDYSYARVNRRFASLGIYLPGLYSQELGTVVVVTDDSGSIGNNILKAFAGEIEDVRESGRPERTIIISCDARVNHVDDLQPDDQFRMECHGGDGTDFRPPFDWLAERDITPACLIYLTDLHGPLPDKAPHYPVLWCCINDQVAPWGETVRIEL